MRVVLAVNVAPLPLPPDRRFEWRCQINGENARRMAAQFFDASGDGAEATQPVNSPPALTTMSLGDASRARLLRAAVGFALVASSEPEPRLLHRWLDCWRGVGDVVTGMASAEYTCSCDGFCYGRICRSP
jgi:hypothetical protein